ncbi:hypothetical protein H0H81_010745 [Sphagnurus paluster]|uniref:Uncharacterized protein n=1 Tax=Sphagnurus paluster TaxID=117069 RepID=A0A9P7K449_9AGAR|nr:hypothetical protein H0H81_010745 [Sphagnurus paluster]
MNCVVKAIKATPDIISTFQSDVDDYVTDCRKNGVSLPAVSLDGGHSELTSAAPVQATGTTPTPSGSTGKYNALWMRGDAISVAIVIGMVFATFL